jgi:transposase
MLGPAKTRDLDRSVLTSLESLVPRDHFYRHLEKKLDLSFVRDWAKDCYAVRGRPSVDPVVFFKLQLVMFLEGIRSERMLMKYASLNLAHRWYLGYCLDQPLPDHSTLTKIRQRLGLPIFRRFFEHVVELCREAGLVWGKELIFDATKVRANAARDSVVPRLKEVVDDHLVELFTTDDAELEPDLGPDESAPPLLHPEMTGIDDDGDHGSQARGGLLEECRLPPDRPAAHGYERASITRVSKTDPDATLMRTSPGAPTQLGYHDHYVVDGGRARIILHALVTPSEVMENQPMLDQLQRVTFRWKLDPKRAIADTTYGTVENIVALEDMGIHAYVPLPDFDERTGYWGRSHFTYDAEHDRYQCPQGELLMRRTAKYTEGTIEYRANADACNCCPIKAACTGSKNGRTIHRSLYEEYVERVREYHKTPVYEKSMRKRRVWVEPLFAEAKQWHHLEKFRLRGRRKVNMEGLLIAAGQNLKRWLQSTGWGKRQIPGGVAMALFSVF